MRNWITFLLVLNVYVIICQTRQPIMRFPDISAKHIVFSFANDLWLVDKNGGTAQKLSSPPGLESWAKFSPDGETVAFSGNYDGSVNIYTISIHGGLPYPITHHGMPDRMIEWFPDGKHLLYSSSMYSGKQRFGQFYKVPVEGGLPEKLPIAHAELGSISPEGTKIAFTDKTRLFRTWKRYRGGMAADIFIFDLNTKECKRITKNDFNDEVPMWSGDKIYYLSDAGNEHRYNLWRYNLIDESHTQITHFDQWDVHFPSIGPEDIVFEAGGDLYVMSLSNESIKRVEITILSDFEELKPRQVKVSDQLAYIHPGPDGKRVVAEARGELFNLPASKGITKNLSTSPASAERYPAWSPDGKSIAYWSDEDGEYDLWKVDVDSGKKKKIKSFTEGYRYQIFWSTDSKKLAWIDQALQVQTIDLSTGKIQTIAKQTGLSHYGLLNYNISWSADGRWAAFNQDLENGLTGIGLFDFEKQIMHTIQGGFYNLSYPVFDPEGKFLYVLTNNHFTPIYSNFDNSFVYTNSTKVGVFPLQKDTPSPLVPENDEVEIKEKTDQNGDKEKEANKSSADKPVKVNIDFEGIQTRLVILPAQAGNYFRLQACEGKVLYLKFPNHGESSGKTALKYFDFKEREEKTVLEDINQFTVTSDGKKILVTKGNVAAIVDIAPGQSLEKTLDLSQMRLQLDPAKEWQQIFNDAWRFQRDYFYDKNMHGVDWSDIKLHYQRLLDRACSRSDVNYVIGEMIGELDASHAYRGGGDYFHTPRDENVGYLGIDWEKQNGQYRIARIIKAAEWDTEVRSPLAEPGTGINEGDYILAVNGTALSSFQNPYAAFIGLAGKPVELTVNSKSTKDGSKKVVVNALSNEDRLRNLAWIEENRKYVDEKSGGRIGYIYVPSTGLDGQYELVRMFYGQYKKDALIIDERFNNGGQIPDRFIEILNRKPLAFWKTRDGDDWQWPPVAHFGPKAMLINGWSGSGGDAFPDYFKKAGLGPLIGTRTWGGLIGISGTPDLIDGGMVTAPTFRMFHPDGTWFSEGHGVDPDIEVPEDYSLLAKGIDAQLDKAIEVLLQELQINAYQVPRAPEVENRSGSSE
ncbi:MAG TPA: PDZ domain-containing protein [Saprospiraceae bacterium]|nr:PDZ domain-containing protein [Saprospiraceae bacterium]